eukprot:107142-Amphidinium_carterae.3
MSSNTNRVVSAVFNLLGVVMDLGNISKGEVIVRSRPNREQEVLSAIAEIKHKAGRVLGSVATGCKDRVRVEEEVTTALDIYASLVGSVGPRSIALDERAPPVFVHTDGCCEGAPYETVGIGAIRFADGMERLEFFHAVLNETVLARWRSTGVRQVIYLAEILPIPVAKKAWAQSLAHRDVFYFVDNEAARIT